MGAFQVNLLVRYGFKDPGFILYFSVYGGDKNACPLRGFFPYDISSVVKEVLLVSLINGKSYPISWERELEYLMLPLVSITHKSSVRVRP